MTLVRTGQGVTDIRGGTGGVYFTRDKSGLHQSAKPRTIRRRSSAQDKQRNCFTKARTYSTDNRVVSYLIYRCLNDLPFLFDTKVTGVLSPDCTGTYTIGGQWEGKDYYRRKDLEWFIWWNGLTRWYISRARRPPRLKFWYRENTEMLGEYIPGEDATGIATVGLHLRPPPADYQIPKL